MMIFCHAADDADDVDAFIAAAASADAVTPVMPRCRLCCSVTAKVSSCWLAMLLPFFDMVRFSPPLLMIDLRC